ncbi:hypothetical protein DFH09DRAFT_1335147 [Mycena vulgaris]|nr:hypothetical protein DFH09DRAFT_1335147 [Mycena vulgaris]
MNKILTPVVHAACIHYFDLLRHPTLDEPFFGEVHVEIEPEKLCDFFRNLMDPATDTTGMRGMFQINAISRVKLPIGSPAVDECFRSTWRKSLTRPYAKNYPTASYGVIRVCIPGMKYWHMVASQIPAEAFNWVRSSAGFINVSLLGGVREMVPGVESCLQYIERPRVLLTLKAPDRFMNHHIRCDEENQIMLRTKLRDVDVAVIKEATREINTPAAQALRFKMATDVTYLTSWAKIAPPVRTVMRASPSSGFLGRGSGGSV